MARAATKSVLLSVFFHEFLWHFVQNMQQCRMQQSPKPPSSANLNEYLVGFQFEEITTEKNSRWHSKQCNPLCVRNLCDLQKSLYTKIWFRFENYTNRTGMSLQFNSLISPCHWTFKNKHNKFRWFFSVSPSCFFLYLRFPLAKYNSPAKKKQTLPLRFSVLIIQILDISKQVRV